MSIKKKLVFISSIAAPYQINFSYALNQYFDSEFWFYDALGKRDSWWANTKLGPFCKIIPKVSFTNSSRYFTFSHLRMLKKADPDIVMLGGFLIPANILAYWWAKLNGKKVIVFTERLRNREGKMYKKSLLVRFLKTIYRKLDLIMVSAEDIYPQFKDDFEFNSKIAIARYPTDIESYLNHPIRKPSKNFTLLFANRLIKMYNPIGAIEIFASLKKQYPNCKLHLNAKGELRNSCEEKIKELGLEEHTLFLDHIESWDKLHLEYEKCDILLFPAFFSNGNLTIIEAMASGMGIVISDKILGVGKFIKNEYNGFNIPESNDLFVEKITSYIEQSDLLKRHAKINKEMVEPLGMDGTAQLFYKIIKEEIL